MHTLAPQVVGIITRHDLTHENLQEKWYEKKRIAKQQVKRHRCSMNINNESMSFSRSNRHSDDDDSVFV